MTSRPPMAHQAKSWRPSPAKKMGGNGCRLIAEPRSQRPRNPTAPHPAPALKGQSQPQGRVVPGAQ
jgi:hypothetical protein